MRAYPLTAHLIMAVAVITSSQLSIHARIYAGTSRTVGNRIHAFKRGFARAAELRRNLPHYTTRTDHVQSTLCTRGSHHLRRRIIQ
eukprot:6183480-Pleurochrysis_carterae.AAC.1